MTFISTHLKQFLLSLALIFFITLTAQSQCAEIESISVAACGTPEGHNEMFRFRVGPTDLNTADLSVIWTADAAVWGGLIQDDFTASKVATLNATIIAQGGCPLLLEPVLGVLPANASVLLVTSYQLSTVFTSFAAINETTYILFQNSTFTGGHFINAPQPGINLRTMVLNFGPFCSDTVTYDTLLLSGNLGDAVKFTTDGIPIYFNSGCSAPVEPFNVVAGPTIIDRCLGEETVSLNATALNPQNIQWTATQGTFSSPNTLATTFTAPPSFEGSIDITLTVSNACGSNFNSDTITLTLKPTITPVFSIDTYLCIGGNAPVLPLISDNGAAGTWSPSVINNMSSGTYTFTPGSAFCASSPTFVLNMFVDENKINPIFAPVNPICAGAFLAELPTTSQNGILGNWLPAINNNVTTTYTFTPNANLCAASATMTILVNPILLPSFTSVQPICEGEFLAPLPVTSQNGITGSWSPALDNTVTTNYLFTPNSGECSLPTTLTIVVVTGEIIDPIIGEDSVCIGNNLQLSSAAPSGIWTSSDSNVATVDSNGLVTPLNPGFSKITYTTATICNAAFLNITVYLPPNPLLTNRFICVDPETDAYISTVNIQCGVPNEDHTFKWTLNGQPLSTTSNLHVATEEGLYEVVVTNNTTTCSASASANVIKSSTAQAEISVSEDFGLNQIIAIDVTGGSGDYAYQLDDNSAQDNNQFTVTQGGEYSITVIDKNGCGNTALSIFALNYPRFITPNNDGYNDTWSIKGLSQQLEAQIQIFDRFGKLVKSMKPYLSEVWDGTLNGTILPADDYWFTLNYVDKLGMSKQYKSHFSLKR